MSPTTRLAGLVLGLAATAVGLSLVTRPFASLTLLLGLVVVGLLVMAGAALVPDEDGRRSRGDVLAALAYAVAAVAALAWPGSAVQVLLVAVGAALVLEGLTRLVVAWRERGPGRLTGALTGVASLVLGVLALAWPDVTTVVVAVLFGVRVAWAGVRLLVDSVRGPRAPRVDPAPGDLPGWRRAAGFARAAVALAAVALLAVVAGAVNRGTPEPDDFYATPADLPDEPGQMLRARTFTRGVPDGAQGWRILYTTTRGDGVPAVASGILIAPEAADGPLPLVTWAHGTTGVAEGCAPSLLDEPFESGAMFVADRVVDEGWAMVATDYVGLGTEGPHDYLVGEPAGRAVLDAARAVRQVDGLDLGDDTVVWGHSQGGHAALWAGVLAPDYAPDAGVVGVGALAPASNLPGLVGNLDEIPGGSIFAAYVLAGYDAAYDDVRASDYVRGAAQVQVREMATRCLSGPPALLNVVQSLLQDTSPFDRDPMAGALGERMAENVPSDPIDVPVLIGQGETDPLVTPDAQAAYVEAQCASGGAELDYRTYPDRDHVGVAAADSPGVEDLLGWTADRFAGESAPDSC